jgi:uncharacterized protein YjbI with pentapeptide repeats
MEKIEIKEECKVIDAQKAMLDGSHFSDVSMINVKITDANLSDLEIEGAQLGGAFIHNIGRPPKDHPMYDPNFEQRPLRFEDCDLHGSTITNCDLSDIAITDCNLAGMRINGILVEELLRSYKK